MGRRALVPPGAEPMAAAIGVSPGIVSGDHVFLTGITGSGPDGAMPGEPEAQFRQAFAKIAAVLAEAGLGLEDMVEMTSYHIDLRHHFDCFNAVRAEHVAEPFPAWTAVEVAGLRREGALVEIRVIAAMRAG